MIAIINYGAGNLYSVAKALAKVSGDSIVVTARRDDLKRASRLILPGVGAFPHCVQFLKESKLIDAIEEEVFDAKKPLLAICVGLQLMAQWSHEYGIHKGLAWFDADVVSFNSQMANHFPLRTPHTGWNQLVLEKRSPLFKGIESSSAFYFNHSYFFRFHGKERFTVARCTYGVDFVAAIQKENIFACQFHPEKSQRNGLRLLKNFCEWNT